MVDNKFLKYADATRADHPAAGNLRLSPKFWKQTRVITSREFTGIAAPHLLA